MYDREAGTRTTMSSRYGSAFRPALSPDGKWLTYGTRHDTETGLRLRDLASGEESWLAYPIQRDEQESVANMDVLPGYSFTPDSRAVVLSYGGGIWSVPVDGSEAISIPFTVNAEVAVGPAVDFEYPIEDTPTFTARQIRGAVPSPDGTKLAFSALDRLYVMDLPNGTPQRLTRQEVGEYHPTWSPDGRSVAFVTWDDAEGHIMKVSASGGRAQQLTQQSAYYQQTAWSSDGNRVVAMRSDARNLLESIDPFVFNGLGPEFVWVPADGGAVTVIGPTASRSRPHFTIDPDRIYYYGITPVGSGPRTVALMSARWDDTDTKTHLRVTWRLPLYARGWDASPTSDIMMPKTEADFALEEDQEPGGIQGSAGLVMMAPQGDQALALVNRDVYVITVPQVGGRVPQVLVTKPDSASMPVRILTDIGGEFPAWGGDGRTVHWSIGNAFVSFDLDRAEAVDDSCGWRAPIPPPWWTTPTGPRATGRRRGRPRHPAGHGSASWCQGHHHARRRGDRERRRGGRKQPHLQRGAEGRRRPVREVIDVSGRPSCPGSWTPTPTCGTCGASTGRALDLPGQPGLRRDHDARSPDRHHRRAGVRRPGGAGEIPGPRVYSTGPGVFWREGITEPGPRPRRAAPLQRVLGHQDVQDVHVG